MTGIRSLRATFVFLAGLAPVSVVNAHHGAANYDRAREVVVEGVVTRIDWQNPHIYLILETTGPQGEKASQAIEGGSISVLSPAGLKRNSLALGERVTVRAFSSRRGSTVLGINATKADGTIVPLNISATSARESSDIAVSSIAGKWIGSQQAFLGLQADSRSWPLTDRARTEQRQETECIPVGAPQLMFYPMLITISLDEETAVLDLDWMGGVRRTVHLRLKEHPVDVEPSPQGHSIGRLEGTTLEIDTAAFVPNREGIGFGVPSGSRKHMVERITLNADARHIDYEITAEDPDYLTAPVRASTRWSYSPDLEPTREPCDIDSARRFLQE